MAVIIPAPNEEKSLPLVLADLPEVARVVAVDNGLDDHTAAVAADGGTDVVGQPQHACGSAVAARFTVCAGSGTVAG